MFGAKQSDLTPAQRAHGRRTLWLLLIYAVVLVPLVWIRSHSAVSGPTTTLMGIAASLPVLAMFASWGRYISDERDEYQQIVALKRIAIATNATMGTAVVWGFVQAFGAMPLTEVYWVPFLWVVIQGSGACIAVLSRGQADA